MKKVLRALLSGAISATLALSLIPSAAFAAAAAAADAAADAATETAAESDAETASTQLAPLATTSISGEGTWTIDLSSGAYIKNAGIYGVALSVTVSETAPYTFTFDGGTDDSRIELYTPSYGDRIAYENGADASFTDVLETGYTYALAIGERYSVPSDSITLTIAKSSYTTLGLDEEATVTSTSWFHYDNSATGSWRILSVLESDAYDDEHFYDDIYTRTTIYEDSEGGDTSYCFDWADYAYGSTGWRAISLCIWSDLDVWTEVSWSSTSSATFHFQKLVGIASAELADGEGTTYAFTGGEILPDVNVYDSSGNLVDEANYEIEYPGSSTTGIGTQTIYIYGYDDSGNSKDLTVTYEVTAPSCTATLALDTSASFTIDKDDATYFSFTPSETAAFRFTCAPSDDIADDVYSYYTYGVIYDSTGEWYESFGTGSSSSAASLTSGETYYIAVTGYARDEDGDKIDSATFTITVRQLADVSTCTVAFANGDNPTYEYTGSAIEPEVVVTDSDGNIVEESDYMVDYEDNCWPGTATVGIFPATTNNSPFARGITPTLSLTFTITEPENCQEATLGQPLTVELGDENGWTTAWVSYTATTARTLTFQFYHTDSTDACSSSDGYLICHSNGGGSEVDNSWGTDNTYYTYVYKCEAGEKFYCELEGEARDSDNNYTTAEFGFRVATFTSLSGATASLTDGATSLAFTGSSITPDVTVTSASGATIDVLDYELEYSSNTWPGTATVTATDWCGTSVYLSFHITLPDDTVELTLDEEESITLGGGSDGTTVWLAFTPEESGCYKFALDVGDDENVEYGKRGMYIYDIDGMDTDSASATQSTYDCSQSVYTTAGTVCLVKAYATVTDTDGNDTTASFTASVEKVYASEEWLASIKEGAEGYELEEGSPITYEVAYESGYVYCSYTATVTGPHTFTFTEGSSTSTREFVLVDSDGWYRAVASRGTITFTLTKDETYYIYAYANYWRGDVTITVTGPTDISEATVATGKESYTWTGSAITPAVTVTLDGETLTEGDDYELSFADNVDVGQATVTATGTGMCIGTATGYFSIVEKTSSSAAKADVSISTNTYSFTLTGDSDFLASITSITAVSTTGGEATLSVTSDGTVSTSSLEAGYWTVTICADGYEDVVVDLEVGASGKIASAEIESEDDSSGSSGSSGSKSKKANTLKVKGKTVKIRVKVKKGKLSRAVVVKRAKTLTVKSAKGKVTYKLAKKTKGVKVNKKNGAVTLAKGAKKKTYKLKIKVTAAGTSAYKAATKTATVKIVLK